MKKAATPEKSDAKSDAKQATPPAPKPSAIDVLLQRYGEMIFDLCEVVLWSPATAQHAFRAIFRALQKARKAARYDVHERSWVLRIACDRLKTLSQAHGRRITSSEQIEMDAALDSADRIKRMDFYFHRLDTSDQLILTLRDKYGLPYPELASATGIPEGSIKIRRQQALRTLEEWMWNA